MHLGESIRAKRQERKLSQEYVADRLGISRQAVSKWETGQSEPTASNLVELAAIFEVSLSELVDPQAKQENQPPHKEKKQPNLILRTNLTLLAIGFQAGALYSCTQIAYITVGDQKQPDYVFMLVKLFLLLLCSGWMAWNLRYEKDLKQRRKNSRIELGYCCMQFAIALLTLRFKMGLVGLLLIIVLTLFYVQVINPKYMNRYFGKKFLDKETEHRS